MTTKFVAFAACALVAFSNAGMKQSISQEKQKPQDTHSTCPMMQDAHAQMNARGEKGMGFSQSATTHHFFLTSNGGVIQVETSDASDTANRDNIRMHLTHIAKSFGEGDFEIPMFVHDTTPPGVPEMKRLQKEIHYSFEERSNGGRVVIASENKDAIVAIHDFLRFQIQEHKTGDATEVGANNP